MNVLDIRVFYVLESASYFACTLQDESANLSSQYLTIFQEMEVVVTASSGIRARHERHGFPCR